MLCIELHTNVHVCSFPGGAGVIATLIHDGFMNPVDGEYKFACSLVVLYFTSVCSNPQL